MFKLTSGQAGAQQPFAQSAQGKAAASEGDSYKGAERAAG